MRLKVQPDASEHELRTERLRLVPLEAEGMRLFVVDWPALQQCLGVAPTSAWLTDGRALDAVLRHREAMLREPAAWLWWTFWQIVLTARSRIIGLVDFKGPPGFDGGVTIGVSVAPTQWGRGYATEAVATLLAWAFRQPGVRSVTTDTHVGNVRAHQVLQKLGFTPAPPVASGMVRHGEGGDALVWRLESWAQQDVTADVRPRDG